MSTRSPRRTRRELNPQEIINRVNITILVVILLFTVFILPWLVR